jgi:hypothetical protein
MMRLNNAVKNNWTRLGNTVKNNWTRLGNTDQKYKAGTK